MLKLPKGTSDFKSIITEDFFIIDKTLFIKEVINDPSRVILIPRPRRFGKTTNMSMLHYFFDCVEAEANRNLFDDLNIVHAGKEYLAHQGQYPVIFLSLKEASKQTFESTYAHIENIVQGLYLLHEYLIHSPALSEPELKKLHRIRNKEASEEEIENALLFLIQLLGKHHQKPVMLLIDEYDAPMHASFYSKKPYVDKMTDFMRGFLGAALKDNKMLHKAVITGILQIAQASLFSGLNNIRVCNLLSTAYSDCFGFTQAEVDSLFKKSELPYNKEEIRAWYNGYRIGDNATVYNPWSIISCILEGGQVDTYWMETGDSGLVQGALKSYRSATFLKDMQTLMEGKPITRTLSKHTILNNLKKDEMALWTLLLFTGYVTIQSYEPLEVRSAIRGILSAPNKEVRSAFVQWTRALYETSMGMGSYGHFLDALVAGEVDSFLEGLRHYLSSTVSYFDFNRRSKENTYHAFFLGLLVGLRQSHTIESNKESGKGRPDIMLIPNKDRDQLGVVIEFKSVPEEKELLPAAQEALSQVESQDYKARFRGLDIDRVLMVGMSFCGKAVEMVYSLTEAR